MSTRGRSSLGIPAPQVRPEDPLRVMERARARSTLLFVCIVALYGLLALRASSVMLFPDERLVARARAQFQRSVKVEAPRGPIVDREGSPLAITVESPSIHADPSLLAPEDVDGLARALAPLLGVPVERLVSKLSRHGRRDVTLAVQVNPDDVDTIMALSPERVLFVRQDLSRFYPEKGLAAQVLGVVGRSGRGLEGLERDMDRFLHGMTWRFVQQRDRKGRALSSPQRPTLSGGTVTLTLDRHIQQAAEEALDQILITSEPESASIVVMDVQTGALLAVASRPTTNPNDRYRRETESLKDRAARDAHEPGSVMKPFLAALALDQGLVTPETLFDCENGRWRLGRTTIHDDHPHGVVPLREVIKFSSNIGSAKLALEMGAETFIPGLEAFGFAQSTETGLPGERSGFLRDPATIKPIELATTAYGQGMTATSLQLASAMATLGNDGVRMQSHIVSSVTDAWGETLVQRRPEALARVVSVEAARQTVEMMVGVLEEGGTGTRAQVPSYTAAGKTGTAQKVVDGRYSLTERVSSFVGLAPASDPQIAIAVVVDVPHQGSRFGGPVAGPAFAHIAERSLQHLGVPSDLPPQAPADDVPAEESSEQIFPELTERVLAWAGEQSFRMPDLAGASFRDVLTTVDGAGLELALSGSGFAVSQSPAAGQLVSVGDRVEVHFQ